MNETEERKLLQSFRPWLRTVAKNMTRSNSDRCEELAAEGWVAIWLAVNHHSDRNFDITSPFLKTVALNKMRSITRGWTAQCRDINNRVLVVEDTSPSVWDGLFIELGDIELAYHHGEIRNAIEHLSPGERKYVLLKYWGGLTDTEMIQHFGYRPKTIGTSAHKKLKKELAHLGAD
jgi:RNA polymerase sigma factor (sigma-70 family)